MCFYFVFISLLFTYTSRLVRGSCSQSQNRFVFRPTNYSIRDESTTASLVEPCVDFFFRVFHSIPPPCPALPRVLNVCFHVGYISLVLSTPINYRIGKASLSLSCLYLWSMCQEPTLFLLIWVLVIFFP